MSRRTALALAPAMLLILAASAPVSAQPGAPTYALQFLGPGSPTAISNTGIVVGARIINTQYYQPLVSVGGAPWSLLPVPPGADSVFPTDVNDAGIIVGVAYSAWNAEAVRWLRSGGGYVVEKLPKLPGDTSSYATAINNLGQVVGARRALGYVPAATSGWLYDDAGGLVTIGYRAYHPQPGTPSFLHNHSLRITRGLNGPFWDVPNTAALEVGEPPAPVHSSIPKSLGDLLLPGHTKCAFAVRLEAHVKTTNGSGTLTNLNRAETAAFAAEIV